MSSERVKIIQVRGGMGGISYDTFLDGDFIGNYRLKKEAQEAGEKRIARLQEEEKQLEEYINDLYEDMGGEG